MHVDGIGIGEHGEVAIIFRDGLSAMSLVRSLLEPQKSVWLSMSFDVETGKNYMLSFYEAAADPKTTIHHGRVTQGHGHDEFLVACFWMIVQHQG